MTTVQSNTFSTQASAPQKNPLVCRQRAMACHRSGSKKRNFIIDSHIGLSSRTFALVSVGNYGAAARGEIRTGGQPYKILVIPI
jgi:hypothetical protein